MAQRSIETRVSFDGRIPGLVLGILFLFPVLGSAASPELARQLYREGNWRGAKREAERILYSNPSDQAAALLCIASAVRFPDAKIDTCLASARRLALEGSTPQIRAPAANFAAWILAEKHQIPDAWRLAEQAFLEADDEDTFLSSGALMTLMLDRHAKLIHPAPATRLQLDSVRPLLPRRPASPIARQTPPAEGGWLSLPGKAIVAFYRFAIRPAIGSRCSLTPSCSSYFREAAITHPFLALPLIGDRLVREPSVVKSGCHPIEYAGRLSYADPLHDHDFWLRSPP